MSSDTSSPSAALLRTLLTTLALDLAHSPLKSRNHARLTQLTKQFAALEKTMAVTADHVGKAVGHAAEFVGEANSWQQLTEERGALVDVMDQSMTSVSGVAQK